MTALLIFTLLGFAIKGAQGGAASYCDVDRIAYNIGYCTFATCSVSDWGGCNVDQTDLPSTITVQVQNTRGDYLGIYIAEGGECDGNPPARYLDAYNVGARNQLGPGVITVSGTCTTSPCCYVLQCYNVFSNCEATVSAAFTVAAPPSCAACTDAGNSWCAPKTCVHSPCCKLLRCPRAFLTLRPPGARRLVYAASKVQLHALQSSVPTMKHQAAVLSANPLSMAIRVIRCLAPPGSTRLGQPAYLAT